MVNTPPVVPTASLVPSDIHWILSTVSESIVKVRALSSRICSPKIIAPVGSILPVEDPKSSEDAKLKKSPVLENHTVAGYFFIPANTSLCWYIDTSLGYPLVVLNTPAFHSIVLASSNTQSSCKVPRASILEETDVILIDAQRIPLILSLSVPANTLILYITPTSLVSEVVNGV